MRIEGNAGVYVGAQQGRPLPPIPVDLHRPHRPWCVDCKRKHDEADLDATRRCPACAAAVITRAEGAARRAARAAEAVAAEERLLAKVTRGAPEKPTKTRPTRRGTRRRTPTATRGVSPLEVKRWAVDQGLLDQVAPGRVPRTVIDAYMAAGGSGANR